MHCFCMLSLLHVEDHTMSLPALPATRRYSMFLKKVISGEQARGSSIPIPKSSQRTEDFFQHILSLVESEIQQKTFDRSYPSVYFLPGQAKSFI